MKAKQNIIILISIETYLRNWIEAGAFIALGKNYNIHYVLAEYDWNPEDIQKYGIEKYHIVSQRKYRKMLFRRLLSVTMFRHAKTSHAFRIKINLAKPGFRFMYHFLALPIIYDCLLWTIDKFLPRWNEFSDLVQEINPVLVLAPSLCADSFTIDMTYTAKKDGIKSMLLINSWDNLVSKGVIPIAPDCLIVWGQQGINQAVNIQKIPGNKVVQLGVPRFEAYFHPQKTCFSPSIHEFNQIPENKKIILYATTSLPFDDVSVLEQLDKMISVNHRFTDYVILFRPHPEMMKRIDEKNINQFHFDNVYLDQQVANFYSSRFGMHDDDYKSQINNSDLDYYPMLLKSISGMICPPTTLSLEGAINGVPCLMICYGDGKNTYLPPDLVSQYENVQEILNFPGMIPCYQESFLSECFEKLIEFSNTENIRNKLSKASNYVVYRDENSYDKRLLLVVNNLLNGNPLRLEPSSQAANESSTPVK